MASKPKRRGAPQAPTTSPPPGGRRPDFHLHPKCIDQLTDLPDQALSGLTSLMERHQNGTSRPGVHFKFLEDNLWELRYEHRNNHYRVIYCQHQRDFVGLAAFFKNQERTPRRELKRAKERREEWRKQHPTQPNNRESK